MKRMGWSALLGLGTACLFFAAQVQAQGAGGSAGSTGSSGSSMSPGSSSGSDTSSGSAGQTGTDQRGSMGTSQQQSGQTGSTSQGTTSGTAAAGTEQQNQLQGRVQSFDRSNNTLTLAGSDKALKVDASTQVLKDGSRASISDIKEGDQVRASYSGTGDTLHVQKLEVMTSGATGQSGSMGAPSGSTTAPSEEQAPGTKKKSRSKSETESGSSGSKSY